MEVLLIFGWWDQEIDLWFMNHTGIEIAVRHRTLSDEKYYMSGTHLSKQYILSCTLSLSIIYGKYSKLKLV